MGTTEIPVSGGTGAISVPTSFVSTGGAGEVYELTLADLQGATVVRDGSFLTQSTGLAAGSNGGIDCTVRNTTGAAANGTNEYTLLLIPVLDLLPTCPVDIQGGATGEACVLWVETELVSYTASDDDAIGGVGFLEYDGGLVGVSTCWSGVRTFTSGTQARAYLSGTASSSTGATLGGFTPGSSTPVAVAQRTIYLAPDGSTAQNSPTRSMIWLKETGANNDGGNYWDSPVFGAGTSYIAIGFGQESATDLGNRTLEYKFRVAWTPLPEGFAQG